MQFRLLGILSSASGALMGPVQYAATLRPDEAWTAPPPSAHGRRPPGVPAPGASREPDGAGSGGDPATPVALVVGENTITVVVTAPDARYTRTYTVTVTREAAVAVTLSATPNPVGEGSSVTVTATLAKALSEDVTIPLTVTGGTSEDGDHGTLSSLAIPAGGTSTSGTITTSDDTDEDDETFTVALGTLSSGLTAGTASSVQVTISDDDPQQGSGTPTPVVTVPAKYGALIVKVQGWRDDPRYSSNKAHTDRWDRVLLALGQSVSDSSLQPMTAAEAQGYADRGWTRWVEVAAALREIEGGGTSTPVVTVAGIAPVRARRAMRAGAMRWAARRRWRCPMRGSRSRTASRCGGSRARARGA